MVLPICRRIPGIAVGREGEGEAKQKAGVSAEAAPWVTHNAIFGSVGSVRASFLF